MRIVHIGDVIGKPGRQALHKHLPDIKGHLKPDVIIVNAENAANGFGVTPSICNDMYENGVSCITTGNHVWGQKDTVFQIEEDERLMRPANFSKLAPGKGYYIGETANGHRYLVINLMGRVYMEPVDDPFACVRDILQFHKMGSEVDAIIVDIHAEASSEKMGMGQFLDGKVSLVVGTHSHIPTADAQILTKGTAYQTDSGMTGSYDSVIGMEKGASIQYFTTGIKQGGRQPAKEEVSVCGVFVVTDDETGLAKRIEPIRLGGRLAQSMPKL